MRDINDVLRKTEQRPDGIPGVAGVYVGLVNDNQTPCVKLMLSHSDKKLEQQLPPTLESYRVVTEITGEIKALRSKQN
jgi:hypothetical protein